MPHRVLRIAVALGLPAAGWVVVSFLREIPRAAWGGEVPLFLASEIFAWFCLAVGCAILRWSLAKKPESIKPLAWVFDYLALRDLHPVVWTGIACLLILPCAWFLRTSVLWWAWSTFGWRTFLKSGDVHDMLDSLAVLYQLAWLGGAPVLFCVHVADRFFPKRAWLLWLLLPVFLVGLVISVIVLGTIAHFANN